MGKEEYQTYKSKQILGRLYGLVKDDYDKGVEEASSDLTFDPKNVPYDSALEFLGSRDFVSNAWKHKCSYDGQLNALLGQYKVTIWVVITLSHTFPTFICTLFVYYVSTF